MTELVVLESIIFECIVEKGIPVKRLEHDIYRAVDGKVVLSGRGGEIVGTDREQEIMKAIEARAIYAAREDKKFFYGGR